LTIHEAKRIFNMVMQRRTPLTFASASTGASAGASAKSAGGGRSLFAVFNSWEMDAALQTKIGQSSSSSSSSSSSKKERGGGEIGLSSKGFVEALCAVAVRLCATC
jgi:hypothetical protein